MFKQYPLVSISVRNGLIAAGVAMLLFLGLYFLNRHPFLIPVYLDFRILLFGILLVFTLKEFRDYFHGGILYFWQGMLMCLLFTVVFGLTSFLVISLFASIKPEFVTSYTRLMGDHMKTFPPEVIERIGKATYERNVASLPSVTGLDLAVLYMSQSFGISFFLSIIISVVLRRQPKP